MTTITALPTPPSRSTDDAATFSSKADTFVAALQTFGAEANLVASETNAAANSAVAAAAAATSVTGVAKWAGKTASYTNGAAVWSPANYKTYRLSVASKTANVANTDPSIDTASWALVNGTGDVIATSSQTLTNKTLTSPILTGTTSNALGSAALPSYAFTGDLNTGAWSPGADQYAFSTGGAERMRIDSSGNVSVGTTTGLNSSSKFRVFATGVANTEFYSAGTAARLTLASDSNLNAIESNAGSLVFYRNSGGLVEAARIDVSGNALIGATSIVGPSGAGRMHIQCSAATTAPLTMRNAGAPAGKYWNVGPDNAGNGSFTVYNDANVGVYMGHGATAWTSSSDERLKTPIAPFTDALAKVCTLRAGTGRYLADDVSVSRSFLIAQDVQMVLPEAVTAKDDKMGTLGVAYTDLIPLIVAALQDASVEIQTLRARVAALEA